MRIFNVRYLAIEFLDFISFKFRRKSLVIFEASIGTRAAGLYWRLTPLSPY